MCLRRALLILACLVGLLYLVRHPVAAAHTAGAIIHGLQRIADALGHFASAL
jgi:hypothetical protein